MYSTTITRSGQVTIPKELRAFLGVKPGQKIFFTKNKDSIAINRRLTDEEFLAKLDAIGTPISPEIIKRNAGKTVSELKAEWAKSPAGQKYFKEKYGI